MTELDDGSRVVYLLQGDEDSDIELFVDWDEGIDELRDGFVSIFEVVGIPLSVLEERV